MFFLPEENVLSSEVVNDAGPFDIERSHVRCENQRPDFTVFDPDVLVEASSIARMKPL
jgi:hypothetical protein